MRRISLTSGPLTSPAAVDQTLVGPLRTHTVQRFAMHASLLRPFVFSADVLLERPLTLLLSVWALFVLLGKSTPYAQLSLLSCGTLVIFSLSASYRWARGPKTPSATAYKTYLQSLSAFPVEANVDHRMRQVITNPNGKQEADFFVSWHTGHIAHLSDRQDWKAIHYLMESVRDRFGAHSSKFYLYSHLLAYLHQRHSLVSELQALWSQSALLALIGSFRDKDSAEEIQMGLKQIARIFISVLIANGDYNLLPRDAFLLCDFYGKKQNIMSSLSQLFDDFPFVARHKIQYLAEYLLVCAFQHIGMKISPIDEKIVVILGAEGSTYNFIKLTLSADASHQAFNYYLLAVLTKQLQTHHPFYAQPLGMLMSVINEIPLPTEQIDRVSFLEAFSYNSDCMAVILNRLFNQSPSFIDTCRDEDVVNYLPIFKDFLPINDREGTSKLWSYSGALDSDRFLAMLIFALHPPEMVVLYEAPRLFQRAPYIFFEEVQEILNVFHRPVSLQNSLNRGIVDTLKAFGMNESWLKCLIDKTDMNVFAPSETHRAMQTV